MTPDSVLILSDYDGTFTDRDGAPHPANREAVRRLKAAGGRFAFSTGRLPSVMKRLCPDFLALANAPLIMGNGAILLDPETEERLSFLPLDGAIGREAVRAFFSLFPEGKIGVYTSDEAYYTIRPGTPLPPAGPWIKINHFLPSEEEALSCLAWLKADYGAAFHAFRSGPTLTEAVSSLASKGAMIGRERKWLAERGVSDVTVIGIGDFENDFDLLSHADLAVCPENAVPGIREIAAHVLCRHEDGAVAELIKRIETGDL